MGSSMKVRDERVFLLLHSLPLCLWVPGLPGFPLKQVKLHEGVGVSHPLAILTNPGDFRPQGTFRAH